MKTRLLKKLKKKAKKEVKKKYRIIICENFSRNDWYYEIQEYTQKCWQHRRACFSLDLACTELKKMRQKEIACLVKSFIYDKRLKKAKQVVV